MYHSLHIHAYPVFCFSPVTYAWHGGVLFSKDPKFYNYAVTKEEYEKEGHAVIFERFDEANLNFA